MAKWFLLNEVAPGHDITKPGDINVFSSDDEVLAKLESWFVDESYFLLSSEDQRWRLASIDGRTSLMLDGDLTNYAALLRGLLLDYLHAVERALVRRGSRGLCVERDLEILETEVLFQLALSVK